MVTARTCSSTSPHADGGLHLFVALRQYGEVALGFRNWFLLANYGRLMSGPNSGQYVSGLPPPATRSVIDALVSGETVDVHLMHRHQSGCYESSRLRHRYG